MKVWITKYALTQGIYEVEAEVCANISDQMIEVKDGCYPQYFHNEGREWHRTCEAALARAEDMRADKIASLRRQIAKLQVMRFGQ